MLYRLIAITIVLFWLTMTGLLVRKEFGPRDSSLREVPVSHVLRTLFTHEQSSDLQIFSEKSVVGHLRLQPRFRREDGQRDLAFTGNLQMAVPGLGRQRFSWAGDLTLSPRLEAQRLKLTVSYRSPAAHTMDLLFDFPQRRLRYETRVNATIATRAEYSLDAAGASAWIREQGIDPELVMSLQNPRSMPLVFIARESSLPVGAETMDTWELTAEQGGQTLAEAHISQLGQILRVRSFVGYSAAPEGVAP